MAYELAKGPIPAGLVIDHLCRNRLCCNPDHLEAVTSAENTRRGDRFQANKTHCPQGHPYSQENTSFTTRGRMCRTCKRARERVSRSKTNQVSFNSLTKVKS